MVSVLHWLSLYVGLSSVVVLAADLARRLYNYHYELTQPHVSLELIPPTSVTASPLATEQLFRVIHSTQLHQGIKSQLLGRRDTLSLEVISSRALGIRYVVHLAETNLPSFQKQLASYLPELHFQVVSDYLRDAAGRPSRLLTLKQRAHYGFPLALPGSEDPIGYLRGSLTKLKSDELVALQFVSSAIQPRAVKRLRAQLYRGKDPKLQVNYHGHFRQAAKRAIQLPFFLLQTVTNAITYLTSPSHSASFAKPASNTPISQTAEQLSIVASIDGKLAQPLFMVSMRALLVGSDRARAEQTVVGLRSALAGYAVPGRQELQMKRVLATKLVVAYRWFSLINRLQSWFLRSSCILSTAELASLYHVNCGDKPPIENLVVKRSHSLPAPIGMKQTDAFALVLGENHHQGSRTLIGLSEAERERHVYILGGTGNGKTTMLEYGIVQDIRNGKGVALIDPHGDSAQKLLSYIPKDRLKDVIYLNPRDLDFPIGLNLLELPEGLSGSQLAHEKDLVAEAVISVLRKIFDDKTDFGAYRIERILRNAIHTAFYIEDATLFTVLRLLTDTKYRISTARTLPDESLQRFWREELGKAGDMQRVKLTSGAISRIERFERSQSAKRMLGQVHSTINFDDILASSKILICNFSKGRLGEDTSNLFGATVLAKLQLAAWRRDDIDPNKRVPFYLYVDEFQNFASASFMGLFSEARKYKLFMTIAQQSVSQLNPPSMVNTILDNIGTIVAFRSKSPVTEKLLLHVFSPHLHGGEIGNLPSYNFYIKVGALQPQEPLSGETLLLHEPSGAISAAQVIANSRKLYGRPYREQAAVVSPSAIEVPKIVVPQTMVTKRPTITIDTDLVQLS